MAKRYKMSKRSNRKSFRRSADTMHRKNMLSSGTNYVQRGGIRL